jgi:dTMP kinase
MKRTYRAPFITLEGIDGAGKSTHVPAIDRWIGEQGFKWVHTREPGGTPLGEKLRELVLNTPMQAETEALLMFAGRAEHVHQMIIPALERGEWVLSDRFSDASVAYQGGVRELGIAKVEALEDWTHPHLQPDLTLLFDLSPELAAQRLQSGRADRDRFELEQTSFFDRVRAAYLQRAGHYPERFLVLNAAQPIDAVWMRIEQALEGLKQQFLKS